MSKKQSRKSKGSRGSAKSVELGGFTEKFVLWLEKHSTLLALVFLLLILALGVYIRILPALKYGLELDASDPWIVYWETKYFHTHGLFNLEGLKNVKEFWWPIGRDFTKTEYLGTAWLAAASYPIGAKFGLTLRQWLALFPVFAGASTIIILYFLVERVTNSKLAGLTAAAFFAFFPGAIARTSVGFVEKIGMALPFIGLFYLFMFEAIKAIVKDRSMRKATVHSVLAGIFGGLVGYFWGGFIFVLVSYALILLFDPFMGRPTVDRLKIYLITGILIVGLIVASPKVGYKFFLVNVGLSVPAALVLYALEVWIDRSKIWRRILPEGVNAKLQLWLLSILIVLVVIVIQSGLVGYSNLRYVAALGIRNISPLVESIQENQPASARAILFEYGVALILGFAGLLAFLARALTGKRDPFYLLSRSFFYFMMLFGFYINKQLAYFTQIASFLAIIGGSIGVSDIIMGGIEKEHAGKKVKKRSVADPLRIMAGIFIVILVGMSAVYYGYRSYQQNSYRAPQILTSGLGAMRTSDGNIVVPLNNAWRDALAWIRNNTEQDALIVSWWDYGYWITVNTDRKTIADGLTVNETQIRWLAELLTGDEGTAEYLLKEKFKAEPYNTYVVFYEVFNGIYSRKNNNITVMYPVVGQSRQPQSPGDVGIIIHGSADFGKSIQMLRISYRVDPFDPRAPFGTIYTSEYVDAFGYRYLHFPGFIGSPQKNVSTVLNTLLYQMAFNGIPAIKKYGIFDSDRCAGIFENSSFVMPYVVASLSGGGQLSPSPVLAPPLKYFKPAAISVGCPIIRENPATGDITFTAVVVFIFQWTG